MARESTSACTPSWLQFARWRMDAAQTSQLPALSRLSWCPVNTGTRECHLIAGDLFKWFNRILVPRARASFL